jgi:hypothetical protein
MDDLKLIIDDLLASAYATGSYHDVDDPTSIPLIIVDKNQIEKLREWKKHYELGLGN